MDVINPGAGVADGDGKDGADRKTTQKNKVPPALAT